MNEPKRLTLTNLHWPDKSVKGTSEWVSNEDYLLLQAENERIRILGANSDYSMYFIKAWNAAKEGKETK